MGTNIPFARDDIAAFCRRHHVRRLAVFGSVIRPDFGPTSDVDVWVEFEPGITPGLAFFSLQSELSVLLGRAVDLQTPAWLGPRIAASVERDMDILYDAA